MRTFKIGDAVVYQGHGTGIVKSIERREFTASNIREFYVVVIEDNGCPKKVFVPVDQDTRLRHPIKSVALEPVFNILRSIPPVNSEQTWNRRYRDYMENVSSGDLSQIAIVVAELFQLKKEKELNFGERKLLEQALNLLVAEIALSKGMPETYIENEIETMLKGNK